MPSKLLTSTGRRWGLSWGTHAQDCFWILGLLAFLLTVWIWSRPRHYSPGWDSLLYYSGAAGIAETGEYVAPIYLEKPHLGYYPPGQSAYLSLFHRPSASLRKNIDRLQFAMFPVAGLALVILYGWLRKECVPRPFATATLALMGSSMPWTGLLHQFFAEIWFFAIVWGCALYWSAFETQWKRPIHWLATGMMLALASTFRSATLGFVVGTFLVCAVATRFNAAGIAGVLLPFAGWTLWWRLETTGLPGYSIAFRAAMEDIAKAGGAMAFYWTNAIGLATHPSLIVIFVGLKARIGYALERHGTALIQAWNGMVWLVEIGISAAAGHGMIRGLWQPGRGRHLALLLVALVYGFQAFAAPFHFVYLLRYLTILTPLIIIGLSRFLQSRPSLQTWVTLVFFGLALTNLYDQAINKRVKGFDATTIPEVCDWLKSHHKGPIRLACDVSLPVASVVDGLGQKVLPDYLDDESGRGLGYPISHRECGYRPAEFVLVRELGAKSTAPTGAFVEMFRTSDGQYKLLRVDPKYERERQRALYRDR